MSNVMGVGIFWIRLNRADLGCWRLTSREDLKIDSFMRMFLSDPHPSFTEMLGFKNR